MGEMRKVYKTFVRKLVGKRSLGKPRSRLKDNIKMDLREIGLGVKCIHLAQDRNRWRASVNMVMNLWLP
jgi:hypothetical protein